MGRFRPGGGTGWATVWEGLCWECPFVGHVLLEGRRLAGQEDREQRVKNKGCLVTR